jgi:hypothetical protein
MGAEVGVRMQKFVQAEFHVGFNPILYANSFRFSSEEVLKTSLQSFQYYHRVVLIEIRGPSKIFIHNSYISKRLSQSLIGR